MAVSNKTTKSIYDWNSYTSNKKEEKLVTRNEVDKWQDPFREEGTKDEPLYLNPRG